MKILKYLLIVIVLLALAFLAKGYLSGPINYTCETVVNKPAKQAWAVMSNEETMSQWINGFKRTELVSGVENTVGAVSNVYVEEGGEEMVMQETITTMVPGEHMGMSFTMDVMNMDYDIIFKEEGAKTRIISTSSAVGNGIFAKSIISFMPDAMKAQEEENLANLKKLIDAS